MGGRKRRYLMSFGIGPVAWGRSAEHIGRSTAIQGVYEIRRQANGPLPLAD